MSRALDVVTLTGEEYDDLMECKEMVASLLAQLSAAAVLPMPSNAGD